MKEMGLGNPSDSDERFQDFWEDNSLLSELFDSDAVSECLLLSGGMRELLERSWSRMVMSVVMRIVSRLLVLPTSDIQAFVMHWNGYSDRYIGRLLDLDHKTAKKKYLSVLRHMQNASPMGKEERGSL